MYLLRNRMNTNIFFSFIKPLNSGIRLPCLYPNIHKKHFHLSKISNDSDDKDNDVEAKEIQRKKIKANLLKFKFILPEKIKLKIEPKKIDSPEPYLEKQKTEVPKIAIPEQPKQIKNPEQPKQIKNPEQPKQIRKPEQKIQTSPQPAAKEVPNLKNILDDLKQTRFKPKSPNPEVTDRLAKLIDPFNADETADLLNNPSEVFNLRMLDDIKREKEKRPNTSSFKELIKSGLNDYSLFKSGFDAQTQKERTNSIPPNQQQQQVNNMGTRYTEVTRTSVQFSEQHYNRRIENTPEYRFGQPVRGDLFQMRHRLTAGTGLQMFDIKADTGEAKTGQTMESPIWELHYEEQMNEQELIPAINGFEDSITLTKQGQMWQFPIDNEQGVDESDAQIPFSEHVFLDTYLHQFPDIAPIQEFMVLALNGLSKNSFLSVDEKRGVVEWYKQYFEGKQELIMEALEAEKLETEYRENLELEKEKQKF